MKRGKEAAGNFFLKKTAPFAFDGSLERGKRNEARALSLLEEMAKEGIFSRVTRASGKQNKSSGIDFWGTVTSTVEGQIPEEVRIPFLIKSSAEAAKETIRLGNAEGTKVAVLVVNDHRTDKSVTDEIRRKIEWYIQTTLTQPS